MRLVKWVRGTWGRSTTRAWNRRMMERGYDKAVVALPSRRKCIGHIARRAWSDGRWALALTIAPVIREELELR